MAKDEKQAALENALKKIEKNFGKGAVMRMGDKADTKISTVPSGSLALDAALGVVAIRVVELLKFMDLNLQVKLQLLCMP